MLHDSVIIFLKNYYTIFDIEKTDIRYRYLFDRFLPFYLISEKLNYFSKIKLFLKLKIYFIVLIVDKLAFLAESLNYSFFQ